MVGQQIDRLAGLAAGLAPYRAAVAPLQGQVLPHQQPGLVGRFVQLGPGDVAVDAQEVEPGVDGQGHVAGQLVGGGLGQRHAGGALVGPLEEQPLAVDRPDPVADLDRAQPDGALAHVADRALSRCGPRPRRRSGAGHRGHGATTGPARARRRSTPPGSRRRPTAASRSTVRLRRPPWEAAMVVTSSTVPASRVSSTARSETMARSSVTSPHRTRQWRTRTGPDCSSRTGRQMPPGFQSWSRRSQCWKTPVRLRLAVRSAGAGAGHLHRQGVLVGGLEGLGHLEGVGEEVALGVAQVGAVEPHVARVEDAVEDEPGASWSFRRAEGLGALERGAVEHRSVPLGEGGGRTPVAGHADERPVPVVVVGIVVVATGLLVGGGGAPGAREVDVGAHWRTLPEQGHPRLRRAGVDTMTPESSERCWRSR